MGRWHALVQARGEAGERALGEAELRGFAALFRDHDGTVSVLDHSYEARFALEGEDLASAFSDACTLFSAIAADARLPTWPLGRVVVTSEAPAPAALDGHLVGIAEAATILGVSPSRTSHLTHREDFPPPEATLACGPIWRRSSIVEFAATYRPKVGRPRKLV
jgi:hypothetical protein